MTAFWLVLGVLYTAALIRTYRPRFCTMLREEFFTPHAPCDLSPRTDSGSNMARNSQRRALLGVLTPPVVPPVPSNAARPAPTSGQQR